MPKPRAVARNADRNPNLEVSMEGKHGYKMPKPKKSMKMDYSMSYGMKNSIRAANLKRMHKGKSHNPGY